MQGSISRRGEKAWIVRIFLGRDENGRTRHFNKTIRGTKKDAQGFLIEKLREIDLGTFVKPSATTLDEHLDFWLEEVAARRVRESTFASYEMILENYVRPSLGTKRICQIQTVDVQRLYNSMLAGGLSARTVRYVHSILSSSFGHAVRLRAILRNPCEDCDLPRMERAEMKSFNQDEVRRFLEAARSDKYFALFVLALETGLRPEEYLALQWKDIDLERASLSVQRAIVWRRKGGGFYFTEPKTKKSRRSLPLSENLLLTLKTHRRTSLEAIMRLDPDVRQLDLVFTSDAGTPIQPKNLHDRHFIPLRKKAQVPEIRLYDLRHTTATLLLSMGENPKVVAERLGHSSVVLTLDTYSHVLPTMQEQATKRLDKVLFGVS